MTYQLRRIGRPPTVLGAKDIMKLKKDVTRFGRHSQNDYFLDSTEYMCLISRWHAEIHRVEQDGAVKFLLRDNGLNGTYVNDMRVDGNHMLELGDTVIFGHPLGKTIEPGSKAPQPPSEFAFLFERVEEVKPVAQPPSSLMSRIFTPPKARRLTKTADSSLSPIIPRASPSFRKNATVAVANSRSSPVTSRLSPSGRPSPFDSPNIERSSPFDSPVLQGSSPVAGRTVAMLKNTDTVATATTSPHRRTVNNLDRSRGSPQVPASRRSLLAESTGSSTFVLKDISNTGTSFPGLVSLDQLIESRTSSPVTASSSSPQGDGAANDSVLQQAIHSANQFGQSDSEQDIFAISQPKVSEAEQQSVVIEPDCSLTPLPHPVQLALPDVAPPVCVLPPQGDVIEEVMESPGDVPVTAPEAVPTGHVLGVIYTKHRDDVTIKSEPAEEPSAYPPLSSIFDRPNQMTVSSAASSRVTSGSARTSGSALQSLLLSSSAADTTSTFKPPPKKSSAKVARRRRSSVASAASSTSVSSGGLSTNRKRKRKSKKWTSAKTRLRVGEEEDEDDDADMTWHYDNDRCDSYDCRQPIANRVSWVQCDDCDAWYHTVCAGANYDVVKDDVAEFHCGCL